MLWGKLLCSVFVLLWRIAHELPNFCVLLYSVPTSTLELTLRHIIMSDGVAWSTKCSFLSMSAELTDFFFAVSPSPTFTVYHTSGSAVFRCWRHLSWELSVAWFWVSFSVPSFLPSSFHSFDSFFVSLFLPSIICMFQIDGNCSEVIDIHFGVPSALFWARCYLISTSLIFRKSST